MSAPLIAHVVYRFDTGGMENGMVNLINRLPADQFRHAVICLTGYSDFRRRIQRDDVGFYDLDKQPGHDFTWLARLYRLFGELRPDLVHTRNLNALEAQFVARAAGVPARVHGEHGRDVFDLAGRNWKYNLLRRAARPLVQRYIAVSQDLAGWLHATVGVRPERISQIYNGVDSDKFHPRVGPRPELGPPGFLAGADWVVGGVGRMAAVKDYPTLVRAFLRLRELADQPQGLRLILAGDGPARAECLALLEQAGCAHQAWLPGDRSDTAEIMRALDVFVLSSLGEGISNTILEAMASGLPVIATAVGGNPELVTDGVSGTLFRPGDSEGLARTLLDYARQPARCQAQGAAGRARIEREFSLARMAAAYQAVYQAALANGAASVGVR